MNRRYSIVIISLLVIALAMGGMWASYHYRSVAAQGTNLLVNGSMERPYYGTTSSTRTAPQGWNLWVGAGSPDAFPHTDQTQVQDGEVSWNIKQGYVAFTAAAWQRVTGVIDGEPVKLTAYGWVYTCDDTEYSCVIDDFPYRQSDTSANAQLKVGIDPTGGTDPASAAIVWSTVAAPYDRWAEMSVVAEPEGDAVTVFLGMTQGAGLAMNNVYWDAASLVYTNDVPTDPSGSPVPASPTPAYVPFVVPQGVQEDGSITHIVQPEDTLFSIAVAYREYGVTNETIAELNDNIRPRTRWLTIGDELIILPPGSVDPATGALLRPLGSATVTPTGTLDGSVTPEGSAPTGDDDDAAPPVTPTPTPTSTPEGVPLTMDTDLELAAAPVDADEPAGEGEDPPAPEPDTLPGGEAEAEGEQIDAPAEPEAGAPAEEGAGDVVTSDTVSMPMPGVDDAAATESEPEAEPESADTAEVEPEPESDEVMEEPTESEPVETGEPDAPAQDEDPAADTEPEETADLEPVEAGDSALMPLGEDEAADAGADAAADAEPEPEADEAVEASTEPEPAETEETEDTALPALGEDEAAPAEVEAAVDAGADTGPEPEADEAAEESATTTTEPEPEAEAQPDAAAPPEPGRTLDPEADADLPSTADEPLAMGEAAQAETETIAADTVPADSMPDAVPDSMPEPVAVADTSFAPPTSPMGTLCVTTFDDTDSNGMPATNERSLVGAHIVILQAGEMVHDVLSEDDALPCLELD
ncbi:MAG: LysM peptidoglycan-binding domain-containing protein, partial [Chloroflexi bacterium]|nr:LysM peptidoglycan-binding domain-containing protein [Chloroflexota bacterium]